MSTKDKLIASAQKNLEKGQFAKAIKDYEQIVALEPKQIAHRLKLAEIQSRAGQKGEAIANYDLVAKNFTEAGFYPRASAVYKQIQKLDPERVDAYLRLADLHVKLGMAGNAAGEYRTLAGMLEKKGQIAEAVDIYRKMAELEPGNVAHRVKVAECYSRAGLKEKGREEFEALIGDLEGSDDAARKLKVFEVGLQLFPTSQLLQIGFARVLVEKGDTAKGLPLLKGLLKQAPDDVGIQDALASAYRATGDFENERLTLKHMLKNQPGDLGLRERLIEACIAAGDSERALDELKASGEQLVQGGRRKAVERFCAALAAKLPGHPELQALQRRFSGAAPAADSAFGVAAEGMTSLDGLGDFAGLGSTPFAKPAAPAAPVAPKPAAPAEAAAPAAPPRTPPPAAAPPPAPVDAATEAPIDFLEGFGSLSLGAEPEVAGAEPVSEPEALELELDTDLSVAGPGETSPGMEMDLDLTDMGAGDPFAAAPVQSGPSDDDTLLEVSGLDLGSVELELPAEVDFSADEALLAGTDEVLEPLEELEEVEDLEAIEDVEEVEELEELESEADLLLTEDAEAQGVALDDSGAQFDLAAPGPLDLDFAAADSGADAAAFVDHSVELAAPANEYDPSAADLSLAAGELDLTSSELDLSTGELDLASTQLDLTSNELDLTSNELDLTSNELDLTSNELDLTSNELDLTSNELDLTSNELDLSAADQALADMAAVDVGSVELEPAGEFETHPADALEDEAAPAFDLAALSVDEEPALAQPADEDLPELDLTAVAAADVDFAPPAVEIELPTAPAVSSEVADFAVAPVAESAAEVAPAVVDLRAEIEEIDFYINQGLFDDADRICRQLLATDPDCAQARELQAEIQRRRQEMTEVDITGNDFFDLASEILDDGALKATEDLPGLEDLDRFRFDGVFSEFKKGIESQIDAEDTESHYNLGIAYKEMGLIDDAINEFEKAKHDPRRRVDCLTLQGICLAEKGSFDKAESVFASGIDNPALSDGERMSLHYEMGLLYEVWGRPADALARFETVAASDMVFRDVAEKTKELRSRLGQESGGQAQPEAKSSKNRVSYV